MTERHPKMNMYDARLTTPCPYTAEDVRNTKAGWVHYTRDWEVAIYYLWDSAAKDFIKVGVADDGRVFYVKFRTIFVNYT